MIIEAHKCRNISHPFPVLAWAIMVFQGMAPWKENSFSHTAISITMENSEQRFFDVTGKGCKEHSAEKFLKNYRLIDTHEFKDCLTPAQFYEWFDKYRGRKYDGLQIFGLALKGLDLLNFSKIGHNLRKMICSELILAYLKDFHGFKYRDSDDFDLNMTWAVAKGY